MHPRLVTTVFSLLSSNTRDTALLRKRRACSSCLRPDSTVCNLFVYTGFVERLGEGEGGAVHVVERRIDDVVVVRPTECCRKFRVKLI